MLKFSHVRLKRRFEVYWVPLNLSLSELDQDYTENAEYYSLLVPCSTYSVPDLVNNTNSSVFCPADMTFNLHSLIGYLIGHDGFDLDSQLHWVRSMDVAMQSVGGYHPRATRRRRLLVSCTWVLARLGFIL